MANQSVHFAKSAPDLRRNMNRGSLNHGSCDPWSSLGNFLQVTGATRVHCICLNSWVPANGMANQSVDFAKSAPDLRRNSNCGSLNHGSHGSHGSTAS